ncbi:MAG TPA: histidine phosphatase family protein [Gallionella sp.]|nr:histidine phosphatase family protein [Gallionella sp.]
MKLILVRHGESEGNVKHEINDDPHRVVNLTKRGRTQAAAAAEKLRDIEFTHAYASEFPRAQQTAEILLQHHKLQLDIDARLNERISGMDGLHVDVFNDYVRDDYLYSKPPHGESFLEQMDRLRGFLDDIAVRHPDGIVLAVSHENPIVAALALTVADPSQVMRRRLENCEAVELLWPVGPTEK